MFSLEQAVRLGFIYDCKAIRPLVAFSTEEERLFIGNNNESSSSVLFYMKLMIGAVNSVPSIQVTHITISLSHNTQNNQKLTRHSNTSLMHILINTVHAKRSLQHYKLLGSIFFFAH